MELSLILINVWRKQVWTFQKTTFATLQRVYLQHWSSAAAAASRLFRSSRVVHSRCHHGEENAGEKGAGVNGQLGQGRRHQDLLLLVTQRLHNLRRRLVRRNTKRLFGEQRCREKQHWRSVCVGSAWFSGTVLTGHEGFGGFGVGGRPADERVVNGAHWDAVLLHLCSQTIEESLNCVFGGCVWKTVQSDSLDFLTRAGPKPRDPHSHAVRKGTASFPWMLLTRIRWPLLLEIMEGSTPATETLSLISAPYQHHLLQSPTFSQRDGPKVVVVHEEFVRLESQGLRRSFDLHAAVENEDVQAAVTLQNLGDGLCRAVHVPKVQQHQLRGKRLSKALVTLMTVSGSWIVRLIDVSVKYTDERGIRTIRQVIRKFFKLLPAFPTKDQPGASSVKHACTFFGKNAHGLTSRDDAKRICSWNYNLPFPSSDKAFVMITTLLRTDVLDSRARTAP